MQGQPRQQLQLTPPIPGGPPPAGDSDSFIINDMEEIDGSIMVQCTTVIACARRLYTYFNTVAFSYTAAFWDFDQWPLKLDWLALHSVNLPMAWVGYEYILTQAWNCFGNIQSSWGDRAMDIRAGMTPILPAFTGFIPHAMAQAYPDASIVNGSQWDGFPSTLTDVSFLEPFDPLFTMLQIGETGYLANIYTSESFWTSDRISAYLSGMPSNNSMIVLNLYSEGNMPELVTGPVEALAASLNIKGLTMEGQEGNEIIYDILLDQAWSSTSTNLTSYMEKWVACQYYVDSFPSTAQEAWMILSTTVYSNTDSDMQYLVEAATQNAILLDVPEFIYDIMNIVRQLLANRFIEVYNSFITAYEVSGVTTASINEATNWISDVRSLAGSNTTYADYLEYNARNQITLLGPDGKIDDYALKQWAGLYLANITQNGTSYNSTALLDELLAIGEAWNSQIWGQSMGEGWNVTGDAMSVIADVIQKWA
ncbi:glycoside hydrolase family 89 protein [Laetiporus sulphureus 93-53]|uniref:Glycoside hydrolase family 89 protein n=1 Tax=Laetiporus sulphureus 93-53 TaxID=1314785 RepID=A0A165B600_9APHY|nr:glycoside hydrolase family 89 protein [Laetiporus sulphureus 93-53]KZT00316.1 glycoside hydrolase family 89 protein [Laetiporus sulphureus 93-53]